MMLTPDRYPEASVYDLLTAAAQGRTGVDRRWLRAILEKGEAALPDLLRFGTEHRSEDLVPLDEELIAIFQYLRSPDAIPFYVYYLRTHEEIPDHIVDALYTVREQALEPLIRLYGEMEEEDAGDVAFCLAALRMRDERVLQILVDRLEYDLVEAALCLGLYGDPEARPALEQALSGEEDDHLRRVLQDAIGELGRDMTDEVSDDVDIEEYFPEKAAPPAEALDEPDLLAMLQSDDPEYRFAAAAGCINRDVSAAVTQALFEHAKTDADDRVRAKCWEALAGETADNDEILQAMLNRLQDTTAPEIERAGALIGLGQHSNEEPIRTYALELYEKPQTRAAALASMWNSLDRSFVPYFPKHLDDPDPEVRKQAISGVGYLGIAESSDKLRSLFEDQDYRPNALFAYALAARTEVSPGRMRGFLRRIDELAKGLTEEENQLVQIALDERLLLHGHKPVFRPDEDEAGTGETPVQPEKVGRNDPCPCGSGKKFKKCHGA